MTIEALVARYGIAAIFVGAGLEGETAVVAGGLLAHQGLVPLAGAIVAAVTGSFLVDQAWFAAGRHFRDHRWVKRARAKPAFARALGMVEKRPIAFIFGFRFIYGFRTISPIAIGTTQVHARTFLLVNAAAAVVWGTTFSLIGYLAGNAFERMLGKLHHDVRLWWIVGGLVAAGALVGLIHWWRGRER